MHLPSAKKIANLFINKYIVSILGKNYYLVQLCRRIVREYDNDSNWRIDKNGESLFLKSIAKYSNEKSLIIDIGCNTGDWSETLSKFFTTGIILCADINKKNIEIAKKKLNGISNLKFEFLRKAISDKNGDIEFYENTDFKDSALDSLYNMGNIGYEEKTKLSKVESVKLDDFLKKEKYKSLNLLLIKADVEGHELAVMRGAKNLFKQSKVEFFQFEFGHAARAAKIYLHDLVNFINRYDYKIFIIKKNGILPLDFNPFIENRYSMINFLAVRKSSLTKIKDLVIKR